MCYDRSFKIPNCMLCLKFLLKINGTLNGRWEKKTNNTNNGSIKSIFIYCWLSTSFTLSLNLIKNALNPWAFSVIRFCSVCEHKIRKTRDKLNWSRFKIRYVPSNSKCLYQFSMIRIIKTTRISLKTLKRIQEFQNEICE